MKTYSIVTAPVNGGPFNCQPSRTLEVAPENILCNNAILPWETNYHNCRLWVIGNEFGVIAALWADCEQDALDELIDSGKGDSLLVSEDDQKEASEEEQEEWARLGNAGEPCDLTNVWMQIALLHPERDCRLLCAFAEARGNGSSTLDS